MSKIQSIPRKYSHVQKTPIVIDYAESLAPRSQKVFYIFQLTISWYFSLFFHESKSIGPRTHFYLEVQRFEYVSLPVKKIIQSY